MTADNQPGSGARARPADDPQQAVTRARTQVLTGRGAGADRAEIARATRERPTLGALPAPLERELVHLHTALIRSETDGEAGDMVSTGAQEQIDRLREIWAPTIP
ncbi:hypothetical protein CLV30_1095 [Haloactinopolyspora alba]|uniref:Uncharacterized protein n=1 Tax=Haloactinopolyspora alba TaxID=648780 RepID=A0A2P8DZS4_9ACTN|nr:hypothetical protein [Haloactinopolyspora alba]PSL02700.1 hypothetical protein CLV30_1095 [Haloactinopolyspora alba]